jgi:hypothetical protein
VSAAVTNGSDKGEWHDTKNLGLIRRLKSNWKMDLVKDKKLIKAIGESLERA